MRIEIKQLTAQHLHALVDLHRRAEVGYSSYFDPFPFEFDSLSEILQRAQNDLYFAVCADNALAGMYMLRGFDEGYSIPAYGVWIAQEFSGRGLGYATLKHAVDSALSRGCEQLMLKVHPKNHRAKNLYERFGFVPTGIDSKNNNLVYHLQLKAIASPQ